MIRTTDLQTFILKVLRFRPDGTSIRFLELLIADGRDHALEMQIRRELNALKAAGKVQAVRSGRVGHEYIWMIAAGAGNDSRKT